ncbi:ABC transporter substrate-binding protein [Paenibacillus mendelii]|uniref:ABC transporter substrate-binding protein n=1 Tax=Paenibacillus mendelii TaxID=206163 RepID=A0ABV6J2V1_9BACL|nr:extracellular solute-binding protein [Paenibacillus mendelii]MCQ6563918.1 extracellular solute-binding protein [Paenibacillus mendelii]
MTTVKRRGYLFILIFTVLVSLLAGCGQSEDKAADNNQAEPSVNKTDEDRPQEPEDQQKPQEAQKQVTLTMINWADDESWDKDWKKPVESKFPNIKLERYNIMPTEKDLQELFAAKKLPDLYFGHMGHKTALEKQEVLYDMSDLIETYNYDLDRFNPGLIDRVKVESGGGIDFLPYIVDRYALHYNKDIFDKFGVPYPQDGITYNEIVDLAKKVTGEIGGVKYYGLQWGWDSFNTMSQHIPVINPDTKEPTFLTDDRWKSFFEVVKQVYEIPGNLPPHEKYREYIYSRFVDERNIAMLPLWFNGGQLSDAKMNWDMVNYPTWEENPGKVPGGLAYFLGVTSFSEHKEEAFQVIDYLLSDEYTIQRYQGKDISSLVLQSPEVRQQIKPDPKFEGINYEALFKMDFHSNRAQVEEDLFGKTVIEQMEDLIYDHVDINTHLRKLDEMARTLIKELENK